MIVNLPPYPAYKPSGVDWLGEVPAHWEVRRPRNIVKAGYEISFTSYFCRPNPYVRRRRSPPPSAP